jgi:integrase
VLKRYIRTELGEKKLSSIKPEDIAVIYRGMSERGLSPRTVRYTHTILSAALKPGVKKGIIRADILDEVQLPKKESKEMKALSIDEARRFIEACKGSKYESLFILALDTGMRPEEYLALRWSDVELDMGLVTIRRTLCWRRRGRKSRLQITSGMEESWYFTEGKTKNARRTIPLANHTIHCLRRDYPIGGDPNEMIFKSATGTPIISDNFSQRYFKPVLKKAKLPNIRLYDLRHTMATLLLVAGVNPKIVSERLGHGSVVLTLDIYSHIIPGLQEMATKRLEEVLFNSHTPIHTPDS